jgi:hypothetical protein
MVFPVVYNQFDNQGRACDQVPSKSMDISSGGVKLQSGFAVRPGELLDISMALGPSMVTFKGEVVHVVRSDHQDFEFGVCIKEIDNPDRIALTRFVIQKCREAGFRDNAYRN